MNTTLRRWLLRLTTSRALRPLVLIAQRPTLALILEGLLLWLGIWVSLSLSLPGEYGRLEVGQPSPQSIVAPRDATYISVVLTAERQAQAENSPENLVYLYDPQTPIRQRVALNALLDTITSVRDDPSLSRAARLTKLANLPNATVALSEERADLILTLDQESWGTLRQEVVSLYNRALNRYDYAIDEQALVELRERWLTYWVATTTLSPTQRDLALFFTQSFLLVNRTLDEEATAARRQSARDKVPPQQVRVLAGESIVRVGEIIRPETIEKLQQTGAMPLALSWLGIVGRGLIALLLMLAFLSYGLIYQAETARNPRSLFVMIALIILMLVLSRIVIPLAGNNAYFWPLASLAIIIAVVFQGRLALATATLLSVAISLMHDAALPLALTLLASCVVAVFVVRNADHIAVFLLAGLSVSIAVALAQLAFWMLGQPIIRTDMLSALGAQAVTGLLLAGVNGIFSTILALGLFNLVSRAAGQVTPLQLMELAHPSRPLLRKLIREAPGTYYHSVAVGNLAEAAAEAINADALLLRVAAYYHDIGKTIRPYFFTDNQMGRANVHNELDPQTSAQIILDHVREGVKMAQAAGLPPQIIDFIATHHGTGLIRHFYEQALQQHDSVDPRDFRYPGPRPHTREQAILMLADSVEATVRSKAQHGKLLAVGASGEGLTGAQALDDLVQSIISSRIREGEMDDSPLTMREMTLIKQAFVNSLQSIYHPRVDYGPSLVK
ncbi:metal dependent phosphohydrolase [Oscillochloris trichoides DG-6]|uniref:Metal dependent phosphohydrolase n=1 Tax=Oscillochloris trichoides DG-6 TaxID=765420 RepID=E1IIC0_9CHLR|nr:HDIG domain-containing metalloprotein [Oscillochloris trichoides]EFO79070.1 metal dependent phosphohydrolase [Oscillochloris trichoides DG-6]